MRILFFVFVFSSLGAVKSQSDAATPGYCTKEQQGTLEKRVNDADVVITGTVIRVESEHRPAEDFLDVNGETGRSNPAEDRAGSQTVGFVKLWRVVKGSLAQVANHSTGPQDLLAYVDASGNSLPDTPIVKLYGIWNDQLCGSYVTQKDTRIFFLKKFLDVREISKISENNRTADAKPMFTIVAAPSDLHESNNTMTESGPETSVSSKKKKNKKRKQGGKKKRKKERGGKKKKKGTKATKAGKRRGKRGRKKAARKKRIATESVYGEWRRLSGRPRRSIGLVNSMSPIGDRREKVRRDIVENEPRMVLVLNFPPARITLANLNSVETIAMTSEP